MTENLIKDVKKIQQALINKESIGDEDMRVNMLGLTLT